MLAKMPKDKNLVEGMSFILPEEDCLKFLKMLIDIQKPGDYQGLSFSLKSLMVSMLAGYLIGIDRQKDLN